MSRATAFATHVAQSTPPSPHGAFAQAANAGPAIVVAADASPMAAMGAYELLVRMRRAGLDECSSAVTAAAAAAVARGFPSTADAAVLQTEAERNALAAYLDAVGGGG